ncbi:MAG: type II toxin-antitoxin system PemK/MazF family toxin [Kiritimatiellia bacterium]
MVTPAIGSVVLVRFPFSDLSATKLRPAIVLAFADRNDWILCQITSNPYSDSKAVAIDNSDFNSGSLMCKSFARPGKLFSANATIMHKEAGKLDPNKFNSIVDSVIKIIRPE